MAEVFDPRDLDKDGRVSFQEEEDAAIQAIRDAQQSLKDEALAKGQDRAVPEETGLSTNRRDAPGFVERRDNEVIETSPVIEPIVEPTSAFGIDLSTLDRAAENRAKRFDQLEGEADLQRRNNQSTDSRND